MGKFNTERPEALAKKKKKFNTKRPDALAKKKKKFNTKRLDALAMFCALAYVCVFVLRIKVAGILTFDIKDAVIAVAAMIYGPLAGVSIALIVSLVEMVTISDTVFWGALMNFVSSAVFSVTASAVYSYIPKIKKTLYGAIIGLLSSVVLTTGVMMVMNLLVTPIYTGMEIDAVAALIPTTLLPFNLIKTLLNATLVLVIYKPVKTALRRARIIDGDGEKYRFDKTAIILTAVGVVVIIGCCLLFIVAMNGSFQLIKK